MALGGDIANNKSSLEILIKNTTRHPSCEGLLRCQITLSTSSSGPAAHA